MNDYQKELIKKLIKQHEGLRLKKYLDTRGIATIGYGYNLEANNKDYNEITLEKAEELLQEEFNKAYAKAKKLIFFDKLNWIRQGAMIDMIFNMGLGGVKKFNNMLKALNEENYIKAAAEIKDSKYYKQTKTRAKDIEKMVRLGTVDCLAEILNIEITNS